MFMEITIPRLQDLFPDHDQIGVIALGNTDSSCKLEGHCFIGPTRGALDMWRVFRGGNVDNEDLYSGRSLDAPGAQLFTVDSSLDTEGHKSNNNNMSNMEYRRSNTSNSRQNRGDDYRIFTNNPARLDPFSSFPSSFKVKVNTSTPLSSSSFSSSLLTYKIPPPTSTLAMFNGQFLVSRYRIRQNSVEKYKWALGFVLGASGGHNASYTVHDISVKEMVAAHNTLDNLRNKTDTFIAGSAMAAILANRSQSTSYTGINSNNVTSNNFFYKLRPIVSNAENLVATKEIEGTNNSASRLKPDLDPGPTFRDVKYFFDTGKTHPVYVRFRGESLTSCDNTLSLHVMERAWSYVFNCYEDPCVTQTQPGKIVFLEKSKENSVTATINMLRRLSNISNSAQSDAMKSVLSNEAKRRNERYAIRSLFCVDPPYEV
eukprot:CAMPEP_0175051306 /NCGR_PEP_ID=MMETSP0052_2-20121109/7720_1 /TAXON_ID=51329 ORGANISM="Polytomella parva, Strain SAG 63-3" /NCGR_SAMPLE_ID=MMETSP0052_2 /ASSEMBLY_ACC=CAM_ASM_000194 /LENGTH=428 /DNA_ID=CAMNT_0016315563 /DNA_START=795 /DNA_END=2081 /DNA_ORIENTATION=+